MESIRGRAIVQHLLAIEGRRSTSFRGGRGLDMRVEVNKLRPPNSHPPTDWVLCLEPLAEQNAFALGGTLYEAECQEVRVGLTQRPIFGCKPDDVITRSAQKFSDDRE